MKKLLIITLLSVAISAQASFFSDLVSFFTPKQIEQPTLGDALRVLSVQGGGTSWGNIQSNTLLTGNGTGRLATTTIGSGLNLSGGVLTATGGSGGSGTVGTSTQETSGQLSYWTTTSGYPALLGGVATGTISSSGGITTTAGRSAIGGALTIGCTVADTNNTGCLSDTDWDTFNNKQPAGSYTTLGSFSGTYPIVYNSGTGNISSGFGTTTTIGVGTDKLLSVDGNGVIVASSTIGNGQLQYNSIIVTTASPLGGAATVPLGGTLALTCTGCLTSLAGAASSTLLANDNTWTGTNKFGTTYIGSGDGQLNVNGGLVYTGATTTYTGTAPISLTYSGGQVTGACTTASSGVAGCLSSTAFDTFNNKVATSRALTVAGTANQITSSAGSQDLSADRTWTLSLPSHVIFPGTFQAGNASTTNATTTSLAILNLSAVDCDVKALTTGVIYCGSDATGGTGTSAFEIATTTDIAVPNLAYFTQTSGRTTLGSVATGTVSSSGSVTVTAGRSAIGGALTLDLNMANANTWTGLQTFTYASTTGISTSYASSTLYYGAGLADCNTENMLTWTAGRFGCEADTSGGGGTFSWTPTLNFSQLANSTSTQIWLRGSPISLSASSTSIFDYASTTALTVTGSTYLPSITSALMLTGSDGLVAEYGGTSCSNQFVRSLDAVGAATCNTVGTLDVAGLDISVDTNLAVTWPIILTDDTLSYGGLSTSTAAVQGNIPYFSGVNTFANVATTSLGVASPITFSGTLGSQIGGVAGSFACATCALTGTTLTIAGTANQITSSAGAQDLSANRTWTLSLPNHVIFPSSFQTSLASTTNATSTNLTISNNLIVSPLTSALTLTNADGSFAEYAGFTCTNQFPRGLTALGAANTCASVANTDLANSTISGVALGSNLGALTNDATLSGSSYDGSAAISDWGLNLTNANTWTASSTFPNLNIGWLVATSTNISTRIAVASTTNLSVSGTLYIPNALDPVINSTGLLSINTTAASTSLRFYNGTGESMVSPFFDKPTIHASSTLAYDGLYGASGTTTYVMWNPSRAVTLVDIYCKTDAGTVWYAIGNGVSTSSVQCTTSGALSSTDVTFIQRANVYESVGIQVSNPSRITVTPTFKWDAD